MAGNVVECPFPSPSTSRLREGLFRVLGARGFWCEPLPADQPQPILVRLLGGFLRACDDPDWQVLGTFAKGVRIGVGVRLPRTPAVFPSKSRWSLEEQRDSEAYLRTQLWQPCWNDNYLSARQHAGEIIKILDGLNS